MSNLIKRRNYVVIKKTMRMAALIFMFFYSILGYRFLLSTLIDNGMMINEIIRTLIISISITSIVLSIIFISYLAYLGRKLSCRSILKIFYASTLGVIIAIGYVCRIDIENETFLMLVPLVGLLVNSLSTLKIKRGDTI